MHRRAETRDTKAKYNSVDRIIKSIHPSSYKRRGVDAFY
jgi:hypothetical protein